MNLFFYSLTLAVGVDQFSRSSPASPHQVSSSQRSKARRTEGKFETGPLLTVTLSLRRSITVLFIVSGKPGMLVFPFVFLCLILRGALHCAKVRTVHARVEILHACLLLFLARPGNWPKPLWAELGPGQKKKSKNKK